MENERLTQLTQDIVDPRREGRNNSGLSADDVSDVLCILHPCTPASFKLVAATAKRAPQHVLQHENYANYPYDVSPSLAEEQETFIISSDSSNPPMDLALRFSSKTVQPLLGFTFGRSPHMCDIVVPSDTHKRISNFHFAISVTDSGVLMLSDMSTNGTVVDEVLLKGKHNAENRTRMLTPGSIIQILSPTPAECLKFIVRFPSREGFVEEYESKFQAYIQRIAILQTQRAALIGDQTQKQLAPNRPQSVAVRAPISHNQWGMHWSGGEKYNVVGQIGKGAFAIVYQLAAKSDGKLFAAKELEKRKFMKNGRLDQKLDNEMSIMKSISHPNIVSYVDYQDSTHHLYIIMEFVACGDLQRYLSANSPLPESMAKTMATQVFDALEYLHHKKITHRDIKPDNILIADLDPEQFVVKLSDFGLSKVVKDNDTFLKTFCGTLLYCAPEVFPDYDAHIAGKGTKRPRKGNAQPPTKFHSYSQSVDVWSFGAVLWYSLCLKPPFEGVTDNTGRGMFEKIMMTPLDSTILTKQGVSAECVALLVKMLNTDPSARPTPAYCLKHPWFGHEPTGEEQPVPVGLGVITEEAEADIENLPGAALDVSKLSISEFPGSQNSELSINSADLNFFDPRQSKRFKPNHTAYRDPGQLPDSSPEVFHQSSANAKTDAKPSNVKPKLFGEISRSDLQNVVLERGSNVLVGLLESSDGSVEQEPTESQTNGQHARRSSSKSGSVSHSLVGAESQIRDMHMADSGDSNGSTGDDGVEAGASVDEFSNPERSSIVGQIDITPRPAQQSKMNRQINMPIPLSFWWDADDPRTHTVEYASKISGHDFLTNPVFSRDTSSNPSQVVEPSPKDTRGDSPHQQPSHVADPELVASGSLISNGASARPRYGRLVSTADSFAQITLELNNRVTSWGRGSGNTHVYPDPRDTRVPKAGIVLYFYAAGIEKLVSQVDDWTELPGLYTGLTTYSSNPLLVNGVPLRRADPGTSTQTYGRVHTGDIIEVWAPGRDGQPGLSFVCEFFHGQGRMPRTPEQEFRVEIARPSQMDKAQSV